MDNDAKTWQACKLCIKTATSELTSAMSISSESKNRVKSTAAALMSAHMAKVRTLVEVQPSIQSVAHCAAVPFMAAILFSVSAAASRWRMKRPKGLLKEQKRCLAAANVWPLENLLPETESANKAEYVVLFQIFWLSSIKVLIAVSAFHGCRSNLWQAWALSLRIIFVLGNKVSSPPRRPLPNSWASISAAAQSVTVISTRSCKCFSNFDSNFRVQPWKFRGASCLGVANMLKAFSVASTMSLAVDPCLSSTKPSTPHTTVMSFKVALNLINILPCLSSLINTTMEAHFKQARWWSNIASLKHHLIKVFLSELPDPSLPLAPCRNEFNQSWNSCFPGARLAMAQPLDDSDSSQSNIACTWVEVWPCLCKLFELWRGMFATGTLKSANLWRTLVSFVVGIEPPATCFCKNFWHTTHPSFKFPFCTPLPVKAAVIQVVFPSGNKHCFRLLGPLLLHSHLAHFFAVHFLECRSKRAGGTKVSSPEKGQNMW